MSDASLANMQSLVRGVLNEVAQSGNSVSLAVTAAIAASITDYADGQEHRQALMQGYRSAFWTVFASTALVVVIIFFGLRRGGIIGKKDN